MKLHNKMVTRNRVKTNKLVFYKKDQKGQLNRKAKPHCSVFLSNYKKTGEFGWKSDVAVIYPIRVK